MSGDGAVGKHRVRVRLGPPVGPAHGPGAKRQTPAAQSVTADGRTSSSHLNLVWLHRGDRRVGADFNAELLQLVFRALGEIRRVGCQHAWSGLHQDHARTLRIDDCGSRWRAPGARPRRSCPPTPLPSGRRRRSRNSNPRDDRASAACRSASSKAAELCGASPAHLRSSSVPVPGAPTLDARSTSAARRQQPQDSRREFRVSQAKTTLRSRSKPVTSQSSTSVLPRSSTMARRGAAISAGESPAVATW